VRKLPADVRELQDPATYPVEISDELETTADRVRARLTRRDDDE
jgi:hypothetical protein